MPDMTPEERAHELVAEFERFMMSGALVNNEGTEASDTLHIMIGVALREAHDVAMEHAARVAELYDGGLGVNIATKIATAIRALKKPSPASPPNP